MERAHRRRGGVGGVPWQGQAHTGGWYAQVACLTFSVHTQHEQQGPGPPEAVAPKCGSTPPPLCPIPPPPLVSGRLPALHPPPRPHLHRAWTPAGSHPSSSTCACCRQGHAVQLGCRPHRQHPPGRSWPPLPWQPHARRCLHRPGTRSDALAGSLPPTHCHSTPCPACQLSCHGPSGTRTRHRRRRSQGPSQAPPTYVRQLPPHPAPCLRERSYWSVLTSAPIPAGGRR